MEMAVKQTKVTHAVDEIEPGDRIVVEQAVMLGGILLRKIKTRGTVVRIERWQQKRHFYRNFASKMHNYAILLRRSAGEFMHIVIDKFTVIRHGD